MTLSLLHLNFFSHLFFISWRLITLQYCSGFCHRLTWISHRFICIPHPDPPSHLPLHPIPLGLPSEAFVFAFFLPILIFFNWRIFTLQSHVDFYCRTMWIRYIYIPLPLEPPFYSLPHPTPLTHHRELDWAPCVSQQFPTGYFIHSSVHLSMLLSQFVPPPPFPAVSTSPFSMSVSSFLPCR